MLAVASLAAGVVTALVTPSSHAVVGGDALPAPGSLVGDTDTVSSLLEGADSQSQDSTTHAGGKTVQH